MNKKRNDLKLKREINKDIKFLTKSQAKLKRYIRELKKRYINGDVFVTREVIDVTKALEKMNNTALTYNNRLRKEILSWKKEK